ncbi:MAG: hypothetical protein RLZZ546_1380 [Bacteroidota bacterium]|jgi:uncharacterized protein (TIGR02452 family)
MKKNTKQIATETLKIIQDGYYYIEDNKIDVSDLIAKSREGAFTIAPNGWADFLSNTEEVKFETEIEFKNCSTIEAIADESKELKIAALNFASAKNPGGGFIGGASAQEESLARSSSLYHSLIKDKTMYDYNKGNSTFLYSDYVIYSPEVVFWYKDNGDSFDEPLICDVITSPAPNKGAMIQHNRMKEMEQIESVFKERMVKVIGLAAHQKVESLILGAWGCGVFRNETDVVARLFKEVISEKYPRNFKRIVFAIFDQSAKKDNFNKFKEVFEAK